VRIIAGAWRGRPLDAPPGQGTRPTADRVRETLFSMLASRLGSFEGLRVADLFAGSGALGLEALSRGAASATFVDKDRWAADAIRRNAERLGASDRVRILGGSALALPASEPFELIFADPPYAEGSGTAAVAAVERAGWLAPGAWMSVETSRNDEVAPASFEIETSRIVGRARLTLLRRP
jgi:16S rRNA (guanine966-N2)-methyltransferase